MANVKSFLKTYWPSILTVVVTFLTLITAFKILDVNFNPVVSKKVEKIVTVEAFSSSPSLDSVEEVAKGDLLKQHELCKTFSVDTASKTGMCVCLDGKRPVGGSATGPTYLTNKGKKVDFDFYTHRGKEYRKSA